MRIFGRTEYGKVFVTFFVSIALRGLVDVYIYNTNPYSRDIFLEIWQGNFIFDKYWQFILGFFTLWGYIWSKMCGAHLMVVYHRGEMKEGTVCRRLLGC